MLNDKYTRNQAYNGVWAINDLLTVPNTAVATIGDNNMDQRTSAEGV